MKLQIISDTHNYDYSISDEADVIVHAGDLGNGSHQVFNFIKACKDKNKEYVVVLGNHDYYSHDVWDVLEYFNKNPQYNVLTHNNSIVINGYTFVGGTLFTNFRQNTVNDVLEFEANKLTASQNVYDFIAIRSKSKFVSPDEYVYLFNKTYENILKYKNKDKVIVVTHFPPNVICQDPQYEGSNLNPYFINDIDVSGFTTWIAAHTHTAVDVEKDGCRLVINPLGYLAEQNKNGFRPNLIIEV